MSVRRNQIARIVALGLAFGALACSEPTSPSGASLANFTVNGPAWTADGREILYLDLTGVTGGFRFTLHAVSVSSGAVRTVASTNGTNTGGNLVVAPPSGGFVFFTVAALVGPQYVIYRVPVAGGQVDTIATDARWPWFQVSDDGRRVAYHSGDGRQSTSASDSLKIVDGTTRFGRVVGGMSTTASSLQMWSFSPDGASLVYSDGRALLFDVASGTSTVLYSGPSTPASNYREYLGGSVRWDSGRPHLLVATWIDKQGPTSIYDLSGGVRTLVGAVPDAVRSPWDMTWSPDGSRAAIFTATKSFNCSIEGCSYDGRLYLLSKGTPGARTIYDSFGAAASPRWTEFSPDGRSVGAVLWFDLQVFSL